MKGKVFVPKKTITVQLDLETWKSFDGLCAMFGLPKTKMFKKLVDDAEMELADNVEKELNKDGTED